MSDFDLDLRTVEEHIDDELELEGSIILGFLDGDAGRRVARRRFRRETCSSSTSTAT